MEEELTALMAGIAGGRVHWVRAPQGAPRPYVVLSLVSSPQLYTMQGQGSLTQTRVQADVYAETYSTARTVSRAIISLLSGYRGGRFQGVFIDSERDLPAADAGDVSQLFRVSLDLIIHYGELP